MPVLPTTGPGEAVGEDAAVEIVAELLRDVGGYRRTFDELRRWSLAENRDRFPSRLISSIDRTEAIDEAQKRTPRPACT